LVIRHEKPKNKKSHTVKMENKPIA